MKMAVKPRVKEKKNDSASGSNEEYLNNNRFYCFNVIHLKLKTIIHVTILSYTDFHLLEAKCSFSLFWQYGIVDFW